MDGGIVLLTQSKSVPAPISSLLLSRAAEVGRLDFIGLVRW